MSAIGLGSNDQSSHLLQTPRPGIGIGIGIGIGTGIHVLGHSKCEARGLGIAIRLMVCLNR